MGIREALRQARTDAEAPTPLRKALQDQQSTTALLRSARKTHDTTTWGFDDYDDPGEAERAQDNADAIVDQGPVADRPHKPGFHGKVAKSGSRGDRLSAAQKKKYLNADGTFKGGFRGAVAYFKAQGYDTATAKKIAGKIAADQ